MNQGYIYLPQNSLDQVKYYNDHKGQKPYPSENLSTNTLEQSNNMEISVSHEQTEDFTHRSESPCIFNRYLPSDYNEQEVQELQEELSKLSYAQTSSNEESMVSDLFSSKAQSFPDLMSRIQASSNHSVTDHLSTRFSSVGQLNNTKQKSVPVDLSHLYLVNTKDSVTLTQTNESVAHRSHKLISECLGDGSDAVLVPRLKALEMYRKNVKKSKDPEVLFQYAQYMLQTALTMDISSELDPDYLEKKGTRKAQQHKTLKEQFLKEAKIYLTKLSVKGYKDAQYLLADAYSSGAFGKITHKDAFALFQSSAKHGHVEAAYRTAVCFEKGLGTTRDSRKCVEFLKFAASRNHPAAMFKLGLYSFHGRMGLPQDVNTRQNGIKWLSRAAARATTLTCAAPYELARIYENGFLDIVIPDESYATELYVQAASLGHIASTTKLGKLYEQGNEVVPQDTSLSVHYYTQAALKGDPEAMLGLCAWYLVGAQPVFERNDREAFQWAFKAAKNGYGKAQYTVGYFHENGKGCKQDINMAYKWYECAAENNDPRAIKKMAHRKVSKKRNSTFNFSFSRNGNNEKPTGTNSKKTSPMYLNFAPSDGHHIKNNSGTLSSVGSIDLLNVITDDQSFSMEFNDPSFSSLVPRSLTTTSHSNSSYLSLENSFNPKPGEYNNW